mgnify:FL=1
MSATALPLSGGSLARRDWLVSMALHGALLGGAFWLAAVPASPVQRLDVALRWAAPEPEPAPPQVEPVPVVPQPQPAPKVRPVEPPRPKAQAPSPEPQAPAEVFDSAPLQSAPAVHLPAAPQATAAPEAVAPARPAPPAPASSVAAPADDQRYQQWRSRLEQALQQGKRYPASARRMGQTGTVVVHLRVGADGSLLHCMLHDSSGFKVLDHAAEQLVRGVAQSLAAQMPPGRAADLRIPIVYELTES